MAELVYAFDLKSNGETRTGSSPVPATMFCISFGAWRSPVARTHGVREVRSSNLLTPTKVQGVAQLVARSVRDAEVVSSSLITQTKSNKEAK